MPVQKVLELIEGTSYFTKSVSINGWYSLGGFVSLFNGISIFLCYLMPKPSLIIKKTVVIFNPQLADKETPYLSQRYSSESK